MKANALIRDDFPRPRPRRPYPRILREASASLVFAASDPRQPTIVSKSARTHKAPNHTLSALCWMIRGRPLQAGSWLQTGKPVWLRWTVFEPRLAELLQKQILPNLPTSLALYKMGFRLDGFTLDPAQHPWAGQTSYIDLAQKTELPEKSQAVRLEFVTPTAFRSEGADIPLPIPGHVFRGCWQKWNAFAPEPLQISPVLARICHRLHHGQRTRRDKYRALGFCGRHAAAQLLVSLAWPVFICCLRSNAESLRHIGKALIAFSRI